MLKGNLVVGQSGGPTAAINATLAGVYSAAKEAGVEKVYGMLGGAQGLIDGKVILLDDILCDAENLKLLKQTPSAALGSCRFRFPDSEKEPEVYKRLFEVLESLDVAYFVYIGGNDSMDTIAKLSAYAKKIKSDIKFMGAPKTVDNDLPLTDHTPGYGSAAKFIATMVKEVVCDCDVYAMKSVTVIEIMGRNAGWLTASAALAKSEDGRGVDLIYLPERAFDINAFTERVRSLLETQNTVVVAVSEALRDENGEYISTEGSVAAKADAFGHKIMSGTAQFLARYIGSTLGVKARGIEFNTPQRCAAHIASAQDIEESFASGCAAATAAINGASGRMAIIRRVSDEPYSFDTDTAPIEKIANIEKTVPQEWITDDGTDVTDDFIRYCRPLIQGEVQTVFKDGLPKHLVLK